MNGQGFGAFASGLSGGFGVGKSIKSAMNKPEQTKLTAETTAPAVQAGAQQTLGAADVTIPQLGSAESMGFGAGQAKPEEGGFMSKLGGFLNEYNGGSNGQ